MSLNTHLSMGHLKIIPEVSENNPLTMREMTCLILLAAGKNPDQCADLLNITYSSVTTYEKRIRQKLGARNRAHAFYVALHKGFLKVISKD